MVAAAVAREHGHTLPSQHPHLAGLRARFELELPVAVQRRDADRRPEHRLRERDVDGREDVVALPDEARVRPHPYEHVGVTGWAAGHPCMALARDSDALTVMDSRRNLDVHGALLDRSPSAFAGLAGCLDKAAGPATGRARLCADEVTERRARHALEASAPRARRATDRGCSRLEAASLARRARLRDLEHDRVGHATGCFRQLDRHLGADVRATPRAPAGGEEIVAEERREEIAQASEIEGGRLEAAAPQAFEAVAVVELAALGARENLVRLDDLLKALVGIGGVRDVRVQLTRQPAECLLDRVDIGASPHAEHVVVVPPGRGHVDRLETAQLSSKTSSDSRDSSEAAARTERIARS